MQYPHGFPGKHGLYDPANEKDSCGVGFVAHIKGQHSHQIIRDAAQVLRNMDHRGACGCEANTGDGAGILTALPDQFMRRVVRDEFNCDLPEPGRYAVAQVFLPTDEQERQICKQTLEHYVRAQSQRVIGWRKVPTDADKADIGPSARATEPAVEQLLIAADDAINRTAFCRQLFLIRKQAYRKIKTLGLKQRASYYVWSFSSRAIIYKGQLVALPVSGAKLTPSARVNPIVLPRLR